MRMPARPAAPAAPAGIRLPDVRRDEWAELSDARRGQVNGLAGSAVAHQVHLVTGLHTGNIAFTVTWSPAEPPLDDECDEVVEVSLDIASTTAALTSFDHHVQLVLPASGPHRVRYCAWGFEAGRRTDSASQGPDRYLLQLWPAPAVPDRIVRQTSSHTVSWHDAARNG